MIQYCKHYHKFDHANIYKPKRFRPVREPWDMPVFEIFIIIFIFEAIISHHLCEGCPNFLPYGQKYLQAKRKKKNIFTLKNFNSTTH